MSKSVLAALLTVISVARASSRRCSVVRFSLVLLLATLLPALSNPARACSTFVLRTDDGRILVGRNLDWKTHVPGLAVVNRRGISKSALDMRAFGKWNDGDRPAEWEARFGSVTFTAYGREFPDGGMNEVGLVIEEMSLERTRHPRADGRPVLSQAEFIQRSLDTCETVAEVIESLAHLRISEGRWHFLVADATGAVATIEFLDGTAVVHTGEDLPYPILTNSTYDASLSHLQTVRGFGGSESIPAEKSSLGRFSRCAIDLQRDLSVGIDPVTRVFEILERLAGSGTRRMIVYDITNGRSYFRTCRQPAIRHFDLKGFDYDATLVLDIDAPGEGPVENEFSPYTRRAAVYLVERLFTDVLGDRETRQQFEETYGGRVGVEAFFQALVEHAESLR